MSELGMLGGSHAGVLLPAEEFERLCQAGLTAWLAVPASVSVLPDEARFAPFRLGQSFQVRGAPHATANLTALEVYLVHESSLARDVLRAAAPSSQPQGPFRWLLAVAPVQGGGR